MKKKAVVVLLASVIIGSMALAGCSGGEEVRSDASAKEDRAKAESETGTYGSGSRR